MQNLLLVVVALLLVALNGFFVAAEFGLVKLRQTGIHAIAKKTRSAGPILVKVHAQLDVYLSACQLGITLASLDLDGVLKLGAGATAQNCPSRPSSVSLN